MTRSSVFVAPVSCRLSSSLLITTILFILVVPQTCSADYYGKLIGKLSEFHHGVSGEVYAVDGRTLYIKDFTYDGEGPAAFFYVGNSKGPNGNGFIVRDERGTTDVLKRYRKKDITLTLPEGKTLNNIKWFSVYCDEFAVNFGDVRIPRGFDYPRLQKLAALNGVHGVNSEPVVVVDTQTLLIPGFSYDGEAPDAKFWVGSGPHPSPQGIRVPDENGKHEPLRRYDRKTIVLTLPGDLTVHQLGHFGVWCEAFTVDFGHIQISSGLNVPPSLKMLGVSPQSKLNCEVLQDSLAFEVRWAVAGDSIVLQLVGKLDGEQYMSFGLSTSPERSLMIGGDVVVAWVDKQTLQGYAIDYFLDAKSQCSGSRGSCPDTRIQNKTNSIRLLNAAMVNGYSIVTYQRPLEASNELDRQIRTNGSQAIIWAIGPLNERQEVSFHSHYLKTDKFIEFGRPPAWNCPLPDGDMPHVDSVEKGNKQELVATTRRPPRPVPTPASATTKDAWAIPPIQCDEPEDGVFFAQMGPTGGKHGYPAITGHVGWGISWYINGLLIPEINVVRGKKYTFVVEGGEDSDIPARYHPFYITDDPIGGYQHKTPEEKAKVNIFAGVRRQRGTVRPTGVGRLCNWLPDQNLPSADDFDSFGAYQRTLTLKCDPGEPGFVEWTPDENTPDIVYYQCFTHRYLGWKINVLDSCNKLQTAASETDEVYIEPGQVQEKQVSDLKRSSNKRVASKEIPGEKGRFPDVRLHAAASRASNSASDNDKQPIMSYGQTKLAYSNPGFAQYVYSRLSRSHPHTTTHLMTLKRPTIQPSVQIHPERQPILGSIIMSNREPQQQPFFVGRKKTAYPESSHIFDRTSRSQKLKKLENKQNLKIETKVSSQADVLFKNQRPEWRSIGDSASNTPFDLDSMTNRKPITGRHKQFFKNLGSLRIDEVANVKNQPEIQLDSKNSEKTFIPSSFVRNNMTKPQENMIIRLKPIEVKMGLNLFDDMEMAADRLDSYYLPPSGSGISSKKVDDRISSSTLIAFDGKRVKDSSLSRSIPQATVPLSRSRLTSDLLRRTSQFGRFKGELPPPIPSNIRIENIPQLEIQPVWKKHLEIPQFDRVTTKGAPFQRSRRSTQFKKINATFDILEKTNLSELHKHTDHNNHDNAENMLSSTGQMFITNIQYVFLTIILYFVI